MSVTRIDGVSLVRPLVADGPTTPVSWLVTDEGLTHLVGEPATVFDIPWHQITGLRVSSSGRDVTALIGGERVRWRVAPAARPVMRGVVVNRGGRVTRHRAVPVAALSACILVGSALAAAVGSVGSLSAHSAPVGVASYVLAARDVPAGFVSSTHAVLSVLVPPTTVDYVSATSTTTTDPNQAINRQFAAATARFYSCEGLTAATDRYFGSGGQYPDVQVGSPVFVSTSGTAQEAGSLAQVYRTASMVSADRAQMARSSFIGCATQATGEQLGIALTQSGGTYSVGPTSSVVTVTPGHVFHRAAVCSVSVTNQGSTVTFWISLMVAVQGRIETDTFVEGSGDVDRSFISSVDAAVIGKIAVPGGTTASA